MTRDADRLADPVDWSDPYPSRLRLADETSRLSVTFGTTDEQLGFAVGSPASWGMGSTVNIWLRQGRRKLGRSLSREDARSLAADLLVMADALDRWWPPAQDDTRTEAPR